MVIPSDSARLATPPRVATTRSTAGRISRSSDQQQLTGGPETPRLAEVASDLGMTEGAVQVAAHRLRTWYREALLARIAVTVPDPAEVEEEIRDLFVAVAL